MRWLAAAIACAAIAIGVWTMLRSTREADVTPPNTVAAQFIERYVDADGRIPDTANGGISHSEGQGYGLLLAEAADDRDSFDRILAWTEQHLGVRDDGLFSWRWDPAKNAITDPNNASDGEILIAWALLRAHQRWNHPAYRHRALAILTALEDTVLRETSFGPVILPGVSGFEHDGGLVVNLSYWVFPALERFANEGRPVWGDVARAGYRLLDEAGFGSYGLSADWTQISPRGDVAPAEGWPDEFGYNAVRIPLHLCWSRPRPEDSGGRLALLARYERFWSEHSPASSDRWNLVTDQPAGGPSPPAFSDIAALTATCARSPQQVPLPSLEPGDAYFSAALTALTALAAQDAEFQIQK